MKQNKAVSAIDTNMLTLGALVDDTLAPGRTQTPTSTPLTDSAKHDAYSLTSLHAMLDAPLREHAPLGMDILKAELLATPDREALHDTAEDNTLAIAEAMETGYPGTYDDFVSLWRAHIAFYQEYLSAALRDDEAGKEQAKDELAQFASDLSNLLADASPLLDPDELEESLSIHTDQTLSITDDLVGEEYDGAYATAHEAFEHMGTMAELLARCASRH
jgi:hypothetical protein